MNLLQHLLRTWWIFWTTDEWQLVASDWQIMHSSAMRGCVIRCIFPQLSHFYTPYTPSACILLFKVAKPEPETRVWGRSNPKPGFGNSRPGLESLYRISFILAIFYGL